MAKRSTTWHTVCNTSGQILAVYGAALLSAAQEEARRAERQTGLTVRVEGFRGLRPTIGSTHSAFNRSTR